MMSCLYNFKNKILTNHYLRKYRIPKVKGVIIEKGFKVYDKTAVVLHSGVHICKNCIFSGGGTIEIGTKTTIFRNNELFSLRGHRIDIGSDCLIAKDGYIINSSHQFKIGELIRKQQPIASSIVIGNDVWIGTRVTILKGVSIGNNTVIGACSLVNKNIGDGVVAVGVPCREIKKRN